MSAKKKYCIINFVHLINQACQILSAFINQCRCVTVSIFTVSAFIFLTLTPNIPNPFIKDSV